jgi:hypothetical protein
MERVPRSTTGSALIVAVRVLLAALAGGAVVVAVVASRGTRPSAARRYACPMHSEVTASEPGDCPICGMALEEVDAEVREAMLHDPGGGAEHVGFASLRTSPEAAAMLRFSVVPARRNAVPGEIYAPAVVEAGGEVVAQLYRDELASLAPDEVAELMPSASPGAVVVVRRDDTPPVIDDTIARVGFRVESGAAAPPEGQVGWVKLAYKTRAMLIVRSASIVNGPDGRYVLVFSAKGGGLTKRRVEIGKEYMGMTAVVSGLRDKEFVVMANTFSLDAERRQQAAQ